MTGTADDAGGPRVFRAAERRLIPAVTPSGSTAIAREIGSTISRSMGAGIEWLENVTIDWTVTYDEVLFIHEGHLRVEFDDRAEECGPGDIVWLPQGTRLRYVAQDRVGYFYALYPVDWAARQGTVEP
jgi:ethanolamine utilization protein EutQ